MFSYNKYSTEEVNTGKTWIDGKPIYRKCAYSATNWSNGATIFTIANIDKSVRLDSYCTGTNNVIYGTFFDTNNNVNTILYTQSNGKIAAARAGVFVSSLPSWVIVEYTKTTD